MTDSPADVPAEPPTDPTVESSTSRAPRRELRRPLVLGAGPVGRAVVTQLLERGLSPTVVTRSGTEVDGAEAARIDVVGDPGPLRDVVAGADAVFQCAMPAYHRWAEEFPPLVSAVVTAASGTGAVVVAAENLYPHGTPGVPITETSPIAPTTRKGRVRAEIWDLLADAHHSDRIRATAVRASDFFGPGVIQSAFGERCFGALARNKRAQVLGDGSTRHSITYVPDFAEALVRAAERPDGWGRAWLAPTAPAITQTEIVELAASHLGVEPRIQSVGATTLRVVGLFSPGAREMVEMIDEFTADFVVDSTASEVHLDQAPTDLASAIAVTVDSYR